VDAWYPYYAGFSAEFARRVLEAIPRGATVLDPWNGSGTTTHAAAALGIRSIGIDLNPFAALLAGAKAVSFSSQDEARHIARRCVEAARDPAFDINSDDPLLVWLPPNAVRMYRALSEAIPRCVTTNRRSRALAAFLQLCLIRVARGLAAAATSSNPTWVRPGKIPRVSRGTFIRDFESAVQTMAPDALRIGTTQPTIIVGDSRRLPLPSESVDAVVTSPPYCTRIDYAVQTAFELACVGIKQGATFTTLRQALMGTTTVRERTAPTVPSDWAPSVSALLSTVRRHRSYASSGYYYKNLWQYFSDAHLSVRELARVLRPGAFALLVIQTSYYKELLIDLPALYVEMAESAGMRSRVPLTNVIPNSRVMANLNPQAKRHLGQRSYSESVVVMEKR
jgi:SAM-dependent methyltransferase